jgi:hypothetical protein
MVTQMTSYDIERHDGNEDGREETMAIGMIENIKIGKKAILNASMI